MAIEIGGFRLKTRTSMTALLLAAALAVVFPVLPAAGDDLVAEMELEITIREISKETRKQAHETAWANVRKTTLYARYRSARKEWMEAYAAHRKAVDEYDKTGTAQEYDERVRRFQVFEEVHHRNDALYKEVKSLVDKFARRLYRRGMTKRLTELEIKITEKVREQIERSYKRQEA